MSETPEPAQPNKTRNRWWLTRMPWAERLQFWLAGLLQLAILGVLIGSLIEAQWLVAFTAGVVLLLTFLPAIIERQLDVHLPVEFSLLTCIFLYAAFGLGEVRQFYHKFWWWDLLLHSVSALVMGFIGFLLVYTFHMTRRIQLSAFYVAMFSFGFAVTVGTLWEILEYIMDWGFGFNMQKSGLDDTMTDLIVDVGGAFIAAWIGYHYVSNGDSMVADRMVRRFVEKNPRLFDSGSSTGER